MTGRQHIVLWLGLLLVGFRMFALKQWTLIWSTVDKPQTSSTSSSGTAQGTSGNYVPPASESGGTGLSV